MPSATDHAAAIAAFSCTAGLILSASNNYYIAYEGVLQGIKLHLITGMGTTLEAAAFGGAGYGGGYLIGSALGMVTKGIFTSNEPHVTKGARIFSMAGLLVGELWGGYHGYIDMSEKLNRALEFRGAIGQLKPAASSPIRLTSRPDGQIIAHLRQS